MSPPPATPPQNSRGPRRTTWPTITTRKRWHGFPTMRRTGARPGLVRRVPELLRGEAVRPAPEDGVELPPRWDRWDNALRSRGVRVPWNLRYGGSGVGLGLRYHVLEDSSEEWNGTRTVSGRVRVEGFRASREQLVRLAEAAQIETREKREHHEEIGAWNQGG